MNEFELIREFFDRGPSRVAELGIGDDAALLDLRNEQLVTCTDMMVQGTHFFADTDAASLGHKCLAVNLSDLAAMGAHPVAFVLAMALPEPDRSWLEAMTSGLFALAQQSGCELIGGDTTRGPLTLCVTAYGRLPAGSALRRDGAQPGDDVWVSGSLGGAAAAVAWRYGHNDHDGEPISQQALPEALGQRLDWPQPRLKLGAELRHVASAAIDVSDGLVADLGHIAARSRVAIQLRADQVPRDEALGGWTDVVSARSLALNGGDDYELAFTSAPENRQAIEGIALRIELPLTRIGRVDAGQGVHVIDEHGRPVTGLSAGHDHFS